jgi:electron transport complex protein RnfB
MPEPETTRSRREFLAEGVRTGGLVVASGLLGALAVRGSAAGSVWQIDPEKCTQCGKCATECVLNPSAVKCVHAHAICGYCKLCFGLLRDKRTGNTTAAENNRCPTDAIRRTFIEDPYYEMEIDEELCIGCGKCVKGCNLFGNGSMFLQIRHDRCINCNQCSIASACPSEAISRVPINAPYRLKSRSHTK